MSLARAIYSDADIYLLDDPLSAVYAKVGSCKHLFDICIQEFLAGKIRILVTHQMQFLNQTDHIIMLQNGEVIYQGTYGGIEKEMQGSKKGNQLNDINMNLLRQSTKEAHQQEGIKQFAVVEENIGRIDLEDKEEDRMIGTIKWGLYWKYLRAALPTFWILCLATFFEVVQGK